MKIAEETLGGIDVEVHVRPTTGQFTFEIPGEGHRTDVIGYGDDLLTARAHARDTLKKRDLKTAIPFINSRNGERGIATGIHSTSRNILVRWKDGGIIDPNAHMWTSDSEDRTTWAAHRRQYVGEDATEEEELYADSAFTRGDTAEEVLGIFPTDVREMFERSIAEAARR